MEKGRQEGKKEEKNTEGERMKRAGKKKNREGQVEKRVRKAGVWRKS